MGLKIKTSQQLVYINGVSIALTRLQVGTVDEPQLVTPTIKMLCVIDSCLEGSLS